MEQRVKSPRYPSISLRVAVDRSRGLFHTIGPGPLARAAAIRGLGRSPRSSGGQRSLAALLAFGLWERSANGQVRLSALGRRVIEPGDSDPGPDLLEAALSPRIHRRVRDRWPEGLPEDEGALVAVLGEWGFHPEAIAPFVEELRDTFAYAGVFPARASAVEVHLDGAAVGAGLDPNSAASDRVELTALDLRGGGRVVLQAVLPMSPADLHRLAAIQRVLERELAEHLEAGSAA